MELMSLQNAVNQLLEFNTQKVVGKSLGVTKHQIYLYSCGKTKTCNYKVEDSLYTNHDIVLDVYPDVETYLSAKSMRA